MLTCFHLTKRIFLFSVSEIAFEQTEDREHGGHLSAHALKGEYVEYTNREIFAGFFNRIVVTWKTCVRSEVTTRDLGVFFRT